MADSPEHLGLALVDAVEGTIGQVMHQRQCVPTGWLLTYTYLNEDGDMMFGQVDPVEQRLIAAVGLANLGKMLCDVALEDQVRSD